MSSFRPKLVLGESGNVCMQLSLGQHTLTQELPEHLAQWPVEDLKGYFDVVVPGLTRILMEKQREHDRKLRRKANK